MTNKPISVSIPHDLPQSEARRRIEQGFDRFGRQFGGDATRLTHAWSGDRLSFSANMMGQALSGHIDVLASAVKVEVLLPGVLGLIAGKIKGRLKTEGQLLLEKK